MSSVMLNGSKGHASNFNYISVINVSFKNQNITKTTSGTHNKTHVFVKSTSTTIFVGSSNKLHHLSKYFDVIRNNLELPKFST